MIPICEIKEGDLFANPLWTNANSQGVIYRVEKVNSAEKMVLVQGYGGKDLGTVGKPFWKRNTDRMFSESWRHIFSRTEKR